MTEDLTSPTMGYIVTPVTWDGTNFHPLVSTVAGMLGVSIADAIPIVCHMMGYDGAFWRDLHVDALGNLQSNIVTIADGQVRCYGWDGGTWRGMSTDAAGVQKVNINSLPEGMIRNYVWDSVNWQKMRSDANGIAFTNVHQLRNHSDVIPMHYHSQWRKRFSYVVDAGQDYVDSTAVPAGFVAVVTNINMWTNNGATTVMVAAIRDGVTTTFLVRDGAPAASVPYSWTGMLYLNAGDYIRADPTGCPIGGTVYLDVNAYLMREP